MAGTRIPPSKTVFLNPLSPPFGSSGSSWCEQRLVLEPKLSEASAHRANAAIKRVQLTIVPPCVVESEAITILRPRGCIQNAIAGHVAFLRRAVLSALNEIGELRSILRERKPGVVRRRIVHRNKERARHARVGLLPHELERKIHNDIGAIALRRQQFTLPAQQRVQFEDSIVGYPGLEAKRGRPVAVVAQDRPFGAQQANTRRSSATGCRVATRAMKHDALSHG
eukprot:1763732-Prymnesium_polylepis.2